MVELKVVQSVVMLVGWLVVSMVALLDTERVAPMVEMKERQLVDAMAVQTVVMMVEQLVV